MNLSFGKTCFRDGTYNYGRNEWIKELNALYLVEGVSVLAPIPLRYVEKEGKFVCASSHSEKMEILRNARGIVGEDQPIVQNGLFRHVPEKGDMRFIKGTVIWHPNDYN